MMDVIINATGSYLPEKIVSNHDLASSLDTSHEWIYARTGISKRHIVSAEESTSSMACKAALQAVERSTINADQLDLILVATCTPDHFFPSMACHVMQALNIQRPIPAFDISAACSGFIYAMDIAKQYINNGTAQHVLIVGSETMSCSVDWTERSSCVLFGDGAGATILSASDTPGILGSVIHSSFDKEGFLTYKNATFSEETAFVQMKGNDVFKLAVNIMGDIVDEILQKCQLKQSDINWLVPHQANIRIIQAIAKKLALPMSQVVVTIEDQGNTSAASIPLALDHAIQTKQIKRGDLLLLESFGGGNTWGAAVVRY